ncbi:glycosyltransferase family 4 protein [Bacteroidota bacterium]
MRIGMILDAVFPPDPRVENEAATLIEAGHQVFLFCLSYGKNNQDAIYEGIQVKRYTSNKLLYKFSALAYTFPLYSFFLSKKIKHFIHEHKIEVVHVHDLQIAGAVEKATYNSDLKIILDLHENRPEIMKFYGHLQKGLGKLLIKPSKWKKKEEYFVRKFDTAIVVTEEAKKELEERCGVQASKIVVVPNTVRKSFYENSTFDKQILNRYKNGLTLLYIGDTALRRGLELVIEAVGLVKDKLPTIKLIIVGTSKSDIVLKEKVKKMNIEGWVDFVGWQEPKLFPTYIESATICISPLHRNPHHDTTYANKLFQYMSFGKALLVSDATSQKNLINTVGAGLVHKDRNVNDFVEKLLVLANDEALRMEMGIKGKDFIENEFCWEKASRNLVDLYSNLTD